MQELLMSIFHSNDIVALSRKNHIHCGHTIMAILSFVTYFGVKVSFSSCSLSSFNHR